MNRPDLREHSTEPDARLRDGQQVGLMARRIYDPEGAGSTIVIQAGGFDQAFTRTSELLGKRNPIFEAGLQTDNALAFADVLIPDDRGDQAGWKMVEVKSSTAVKDYHRDEVAVQAYIGRNAGLDLRSVSVAYVDSSWVYPGDENYVGLLTEDDLSAEAFARFDEVDQWVVEAHRVAQLASEPEREVGDHCYSPFECIFCDYCRRDLTQPEYPLSCLPRLSAKKKQAIEEQGINDARLVPDHLLNDVQRRVKTCTVTKAPYFDGPGAAADLQHYGFPAYFLDFESIQFAVPIWKGTRPYQQHVFQFSIHVVTATGDVSHDSFLDLTGADPCASLAPALIQACGDAGPIFVYNAAFERTRIQELIDRRPGHGDGLRGILDRIVDLLPIARNRFYHPSQMGSWSIKAVLPAVAPDLRYSELAGVQDGGMAMEAFLEAIATDTPEERKVELERQLLKYCELDTLAMVRLWRVFSNRDKFPTEMLA